MMSSLRMCQRAAWDQVCKRSTRRWFTSLLSVLQIWISVTAASSGGGSTQTHWRYSTLNDQEELDSSSKDAIPHQLPTCNTDSHADGANRKTPVRICSHSRDWKSCKIQHARRCRRVSRLLSTSHALTFYPHTSLFCHIWLSDLVLLTGDGQQHRDVAPEESCNPTQPWCKLKSVTAG